MSPDRVALAGLEAKRRRYEVARALMWGLIVCTLILALITLLILVADVRDRQRQALRNQQTLQTLQEQNRTLLEASRLADIHRQQVVQDAISELARREQAQLDEMERRILARQQVLADLMRQIRQAQTRQAVPDPVLVPVPVRATPRPAPSPTPQVSPQARCEQRGHSGKCK